MDNKEDIEHLIKEAQVELQQLEEKQREVEKIRELRIQKGLLTKDIAPTDYIEPKVTKIFLLFIK